MKTFTDSARKARVAEHLQDLMSLADLLSPASSLLQELAEASSQLCLWLDCSFSCTKPTLV